jgi:hypothetical protein
MTSQKQVHLISTLQRKSSQTGLTQQQLTMLGLQLVSQIPRDMLIDFWGKMSGSNQEVRI